MKACPLRISLSAALCLISFLAISWSRAIEAWESKSNGWSIKIEESLQDGCYMTKLVANRYYLRAQFSTSSDIFQFAVGNSRWNFIEQGALYDVSIEFGSQSNWQGKAYGTWFEEMPAFLFYVNFDDRRAEGFITDLTHNYSLKIKFMNDITPDIPLVDVYDAMKQLIRCQRSMLNGSDISQDTDVILPRGSENPFR